MVWNYRLQLNHWCRKYNRAVVLLKVWLITWCGFPSIFLACAMVCRVCFGCFSLVNYKLFNVQENTNLTESGFSLPFVIACIPESKAIQGSHVQLDYHILGLDSLALGSTSLFFSPFFSFIIFLILWKFMLYLPWGGPNFRKSMVHGSMFSGFVHDWSEIHCVSILKCW